ncbi:cation diffusion facilitator family transporter [Saccharothrix syringae]|uniref:cation diffusion facilitator family transporter n=1 Tax=Saccharothrix syringae TaxID=103733 RepID=UPI000ADB333F|nr:cation transporter [Saccharothrix syringae]
MATEGSTRAVVTAMFANLGITATKFVAFLLTASSSMLAESVHSLADTSNQALLLLGGKRAKRAPTPEHQFGYGRERYVHAFIVSIVLFSVGGLFALYEA